MSIATVVIIGFTLIVWREQESGGACYQQSAAKQEQSSQPTNNGVSPNQANQTESQSESYFCRLIAPTNLPTDYLVLIGAGAVLAALETLRAIEGQVTAAIDSDRAWVMVESVTASDQMGKAYDCYPKIANAGKTIARIKKVCGTGAVVRLKESLPEVPNFKDAEVEELNFVCIQVEPLSPLRFRSIWIGLGMPILDFSDFICSGISNMRTFLRQSDIRASTL